VPSREVKPPKKPAKNIIYMVSDGMSLGAFSLADQYLMVTAGRPSHWHRLMGEADVVNGLMDTRSLNSLVTDSAAASSSWGSGRHVWNGMLNCYPDGTKLRVLYHVLAEQARMRTGLVTTTRITHATPAGFSVNSMRRDDEDLIASEQLKARVDVLLGGGSRHFDSATRRDKRDLFGEASQAGYQVAKTKEDLLKTTSGKVLGLFHPSSLPFTVDHLASEELKRTIPTLKEMSMKAIDLLKGSSDGFVLQIEAARVDHAAHPNDSAGLLFDQIAFDDAVQSVMEWARQDGETAVVVTSDHGNANPGLNGSGPEYGNSTKGLEVMALAKSSYEAMVPQLPKEWKASDLQEMVEAKLAIKLTTAEAELVVSAREKKSPLSSHSQYGSVENHLGIVLGNTTHIGWTGSSHTSDTTLVTAFGPGKEFFQGVTANIDVFNWFLSHRGLKVTNPEMTFEDARKFMDSGRTSALAATEDHWV
jgi:alkaline phosphatase